MNEEAASMMQSTIRFLTDAKLEILKEHGECVSPPTAIQSRIRLLDRLIQYWEDRRKEITQ